MDDPKTVPEVVARITDLSYWEKGLAEELARPEREQNTGWIRVAKARIQAIKQDQQQ